MLTSEGLGAQAETRGLIDLADEQTIQRPIELHEAVEIDLVQAELRTFGIDTEIKGAAIDGLDLGHDQFQAVFAAYAIAGAVQHTHQG